MTDDPCLDERLLEWEKEPSQREGRRLLAAACTGRADALDKMGQSARRLPTGKWQRS